MKKVKFILLSSLILGLIGCAKGGEPQEITYKNISNLGPVEFTIQPAVIEQEEVVESVPDYVIEKMEAVGDGELQERTMSRRTYVHNKPDETSAQLGRLEWGDTIQVIEATEDEEWFKISYNGRVAYITAANVRKEGEVVNTPVVNQPAVTPVIDPAVTDNTVVNTTPTDIPVDVPTVAPTETPVEIPIDTPVDNAGGGND